MICARRLVIFAFAAVSWLAMTATSRAELTLVAPDQPPLPIFAAAQSPQNKTAADQLANYLSQISVAKFVVAKWPATLPEKAIIVGHRDDTLPADLGPDAFRIKTIGQQLHLVGGNDLGTLYAVFAFLEEQLGCRWWSHDEEDVPTGRSTIVLPNIDQTTRPVFSLHNVWNREAQTTNRLFHAKSRATSTENFTGGHTLYPLLNPFALQNPAFYPLNKKTGERKWNDLHFCYLAPGIADALTTALDKQVAARKGKVDDVIYFAGMGDWYGGMCECDACQKVYEAETWTDPDGRRKPGYSATLLQMVNQAAASLEKKYPGIRVGTFAYMSLEAPPAKTVPRDNVVIRVPRLRHCGVHPARSCEKNRSFARNVERWCQLAPQRTYIWEYGSNYHHMILPYPTLGAMADNLRFYHELGVRGVEIQGNYVSLGGDLAVTKNYVWRKVMANPTLDPQQVLTDFCRGYFGPASEELLAYITTIERSVVEPKRTCADEFAAPSYITPILTTELQKLRATAIAKAVGQEPFARRVLEATAGIEALQLWHPGPLEERAGRLIRQDVGADTVPRAESLLASIRAASPNEFSDGRAAQQTFLTYQGGPLVTLSHGSLVAQVAPLLNGQLRQISFHGEPLLHVESNWRVKNFPLVGGGNDALGTRLMKIEDTPTPQRVALIGDAGLGLWGGQVKSEVRKVIEAKSDNRLTMHYFVRRLPGNTEAKFSGVLSTDYAVGKKIDDLKIETRSREGTWATIELPTDKSAATLAALTAVRIRLPQQRTIVVDDFATPGAASGKLTLDRQTGVLNVSITTQPIETTMNAELSFVARELSFSQFDR